MSDQHVDIDGYEVEMLGTCMTNTRQGSHYNQIVQAKHLWSYAQEEALIAVCEQGGDKCWRIITDPERRAKRIAARYADLYFSSRERSRGKVQFLWPALAAFVVKDIVQAFRYTREEVLNGGWRNAMRTSTIPTAFSEFFSSASPYEHSLRVYTTLAKGNLWLFMDIYPWYWYILQYGISSDANLHAERLQTHIGERDTTTLQRQSKAAIENLPFSANWLQRIKIRIEKDPVYAKAAGQFQFAPAWSGIDGGYGQHQANAIQAHRYVRAHAKDYDEGYRIPPSQYWSNFKEAFYVMEEERKELKRIADDKAATERLERLSNFRATTEIRDAYQQIISEYTDNDKSSWQKKEVRTIAKHEQLNFLQSLIYNDPKLVQTMDMNHLISRASLGSLSPTYTLYFSAAPSNKNPDLQATFDPPTGSWDWLTGRKASLPHPKDRMAYVDQIARKFERLMENKPLYMEGELQKIRGWLNA